MRKVHLNTGTGLIRGTIEFVYLIKVRLCFKSSETHKRYKILLKPDHNIFVRIAFKIDQIGPYNHDNT